MYREQLNNTKALIEGGIVKWTEYEEQYKEALDWLSKTEKLVQSFNKLQNDLEQKKVVLEEFQVSNILQLRFLLLCNINRSVKQKTQYRYLLFIVIKHEFAVFLCYILIVKNEEPFQLYKTIFL